MALKLALEEYGAGRPIVVAHGVFGSRANWRSLGRRLAAGSHVFLLDLRNHGDSPRSETHDYPSIAADILRFLECRDLTRVVLLGHSMGGKAAMQLAVTAPERLSKLIVVDIAPRAYPLTPAREVLDALLGVELGGVTARGQVDAQLAAFGLEPHLRRFLMMGLRRSSSGRYGWKFNLPAIASNWSRLGVAISAGRFEGPTLFIRGERSGYLSVDDEALAREYFPDCMLAVISGAGHWPNAEAPSETLRVIEEFLSR